MTLTALASTQHHAAAALEPGEEYLAAMRIADPDNGRPLRDPILGPVGMLFTHDRALLEQTATVTMPSTGGILAVTGARVIVFGLGVRLGPTELLDATARAGVTLDTDTFHASLVKRVHVRLYARDRLFVNASVRASNPDLPAVRDLIPAR